MDSLIQITKNTINGTEINSFNARETYDFLGLSKSQFSRWIKSAIEKYDFVQNEDYIIIDTDVEGVKDYIVSLDMAKELCLVSNTQKGKETRKYFINFEKQNQRPLTINEQIILIAQGHQEVEQRLTQIEHKIENDITLTSAQKYHLKQLVSQRAYELKERHKFEDTFMSKVFARFYKKLKKQFVVSSYLEIPKSKFDEACSIINNVTFGDLI
jgi:anti-repressor protein